MQTLIDFVESKRWVTPQGADVIDVVMIKDFLNSNTEHCVACGASLKKYWHKITPLLVKALAQAYKVVAARGENHFDKQDLDLSHTEYGNFQKLRFHGLIAKYRVDGQWQKGAWLITRRGADFLKAQIQIPVSVLTFRNRVIDHSEQMVTLKEVVGSDPYFEQSFDFGLFDPVKEGIK